MKRIFAVIIIGILCLPTFAALGRNVNGSIDGSTLPPEDVMSDVAANGTRASFCHQTTTVSAHTTPSETDVTVAHVGAMPRTVPQSVQPGSGTPPPVVYTEQLGLTFTQNFVSVAYNVTAVEQADSYGYGPAYLLNGLSNAGYWYQVGLCWDWPYVAGGYAAGFYAIYAVFNSNGKVVFPPGGGAKLDSFSASVNDGDAVLLNLYFSGGNMVMYVYDWNTSAHSVETYSAMGATYFEGLGGPSNSNGFFSGLMTEWWRVNPYYGGEEAVMYSDSTFALSSAWMWADEWNPNNGTVLFWGDQFVSYSNPNQLQSFGTNGAMEASDAYLFITGTCSLHSDSQESSGATANYGNVVFNDVQYNLPTDFSSPPGSFPIYYLSSSGYTFDHWVTTGGVSVLDGQVNSTDATVLGQGTLRAIYSAEARAYYSVEPVPISPLTDINGSLNGLETPATPSPVNLNFNVEIHLRNATLTNTPVGVGGLEVHFYLGNILLYAVPTGFVCELGQAGWVLTGPSLIYAIYPGFYDAFGNLVSNPPYAGAVHFDIAAGSTNGPWWDADGLVAIISFRIIKQPQGSLGEPTVTLQLANDYTDLPDENAEQVPHFRVQGTLTIDASSVVPTYLVVRGADSRIYYRVSLGDSWGDWNVLPGATSDSPAAAVYQGQLWIVVRGMDGSTLWYGYLTNPADPTSFSGWTLLSGATSSAPTLTSNSTTLCLVVRGEDNLIYYRFHNNSSWGDWAALPSGATLDSPAAALLGGELHIVVCGMDGYSLWRCYVNLTDNSFSGWTLLSGVTQSKPILATDQTENKLCLTVTGLDGRIYWRTYDAIGQSWADWNVVPSGATPEGPAATIFGGALQIVVQGMDGSTIWQGNIDLATTNFSGWTLLDGATPSAPTLTS